MADISIAEAKIYILYLVRAVPGISFNMLEENSADSLYMNYFTFNQAYSELTAGNLIDKHFETSGVTEALGGTETLTITSGGSAMLDEVLPAVSQPLLEHLKLVAKKLTEIKNEKTSITTEITPEENGKFKVTLFSDREGRSFNVSFLCADEDEARKICKAWKSGEDKAVKAFLDSLG